MAFCCSLSMCFPNYQRLNVLQVYWPPGVPLLRDACSSLLTIFLTGYQLCLICSSYLCILNTNLITVRNGVFPAISVNKDVTVIRDSSPPGHSGGRRPVPPGSHQTAMQPLSMVSTKELECEDSQQAGPRQLSCN